MSILIVEPSRVGIRLIGRLLSADNFDVRIAQDGATALDLFRSDASIDVVMTRFELTDMSGVELCWQLRVLASNEHRPLHVLAMSTNRDTPHLVQALDAGADEFIHLPLNAIELFARLRMAHRHLDMQRQLVHLAEIDEVTGVRNRRAFFAKVRASLADGASGTLGVLDLDRFKSVNDTYGHAVGDAVLSMVGRVIRDLRGTVGRIGGEEFAVFLNEDPTQAICAIEQLRGRIEAEPIVVAGATLHVTASIGTARSRVGEPIDRTFVRADLALYRAKRSGRNRVCAWSEADDGLDSAA